MAPARITDDSDSDVEFEDVPMNNSAREEFGDIPAFLQPQTWTPSLSLPPQRPEPIPSGSPEETQVRGQISTRIESVAYRKLQHDIGMESSHSTGPGGRYESFAELAHDVDGLVNTIWASATPAVQTEPLITLAGLTQSSLMSFPFSVEATLSIFHKFDCIFEALCTGAHPMTGSALPGAVVGQSLLTETQKVRIRSLAETTRFQVFASFSASSTSVGAGDDDDEEEHEDPQFSPMMFAATKVYEKTLMLLAEQGDVATDEGYGFA